jgi:hypothetical protein
MNHCIPPFFEGNECVNRKESFIILFMIFQFVLCPSSKALTKQVIVVR